MNAIVVMAVLVVAGTVNVVTATTLQPTNRIMLKDIIGGIANLFTKDPPVTGNKIGVDDTEEISFVENWGNNYHGKAGKDKKNRAFEVINSNYEVPEDAQIAINKSAFIFDGDNDFSADMITDFLTKTGAVESGYRTKKQMDDGPARSYWQVEPKTAKSLLNNSSALFGDKFNKEFAQYAEGDATASQVLADKSLEELSSLMEADSNLGAALATAKIVTTFKK
jgi:hypothetical protein